MLADFAVQVVNTDLMGLASGNLLEGIRKTVVSRLRTLEELTLHV